MKKLAKFLCVAIMLACFTCFLACDPIEDSSKDSSTVTQKTDITVTVTNQENGKIYATYTGEPIEVEYQATEGVQLTVTYAGAGETVYEESANAPIDAGQYLAKLSFEGNDTYNAYETAIEIEIEKAYNTFDFTVANANEGEELQIEVLNNLAGEITYVYKGRGETVYEESETAPTMPGTYTVTATVASTKNYYGSKKSVDFEIFSNDPLYGLSNEIKEQVANLIRIENLSLAGSSYNTNVEGQVSITGAGVVSANQSGLMIMGSEFDADRYQVVVYSSSSIRAYFRFAISGASTYDEVVNDCANYNILFGDVALPQGVSVITLAPTTISDFVGDKNAEITGVHVLFSDYADVKIYGFYKSRALTMDDVPAELLAQVEGKYTLEYKKGGASYNTNGTIATYGNILSVEKENMAVMSANMPSKVYMIVNSADAVTAYFRFAVKNAYSYDQILNQDTIYCKYFNAVNLSEGFQLLTIDMQATDYYTGDKNEPVTGFHILFSAINSNFALYGIWSDTEPGSDPIVPPVVEEGVPAELLAQVEDKTALEFSAAAGSWDTNSDVVTGEDGEVSVTSSHMSILVDGITNKVYMLVKSNSAVTGYFRFAIDGKVGYAEAVNEFAKYTKCFNEVAMAEGYQLLEITLNPQNGYEGSADAAITGFHLLFTEKTPFTIYGIYVDAPVVEEGVPAELLAQVEGKTSLEFSAAAGSWDTNSDVVTGEDGEVSVTSSHMSILVDGITNKVYMLVKSNSAVTGYFRFAIDGKVGYAEAVNEFAKYTKCFNEVAMAEGYQLLEITLNPQNGYEGPADAAITGFHLLFTEKTPFTVYGIYVDAPVVEEGVPAELLAQVEGKTALEFSAAAGSWDTNSDVVTGEDGEVSVTSSHMSILVDGITNKVYMLVKSNSAVTGYFRFAIDGKVGYAEAVNEFAKYTKCFNEVAMAEGYQLLEITLNPQNGYEGSADAAITGFHLMFTEKIPFTIYGIYVDAPVVEEGVPAELLAQVEGKTSLEFSAAAGSWDTNSDVVTGEDGEVSVTSSHMSILVDGITNKVYMLVKSNSAVTGYFRFAIDGKVGYAEAVNEFAKYTKCFNEVAMAEGYQLLEITLNPQNGYEGSADAAITGFHLLFTEKTPFTIYGIYVDAPVVEEGVPAELLAQVASKTALNFTAGPASWDTNSDVVAGENGSVSVTSSHIAILVNGIEEKIYILLKAESAIMGYFRFAIQDQVGYGEVVNNPNTYCKYFNEEAIAEGYQLLEINLRAFATYAGDANEPVTGFHLLFSAKTPFTIYGIYVD